MLLNSHSPLESNLQPAVLSNLKATAAGAFTDVQWLHTKKQEASTATEEREGSSSVLLCAVCCVLYAVCCVLCAVPIQSIEPSIRCWNEDFDHIPLGTKHAYCTAFSHYTRMITCFIISFFSCPSIMSYKWTRSLKVCVAGIDRVTYSFC